MQSQHILQSDPETEKQQFAGMPMRQTLLYAAAAMGPSMKPYPAF